MSKESYYERLRRIKKKHPRAYELWSEKEERILKTMYLNAWRQGYLPTQIIKELSKIFQRQPSAIRARLRKSGLIKS